METKPRILYLKKILEERTDEENPLSTTQLINILNDEYGISAHRTTITKDIAALQEFGVDIVIIHSTQSKYFVASRKFELPELKLLIDAVESSKFITNKKSDALIEKIHTLTSPGLAAKLKRNNYVFNRIKPDNEQIYYITDVINDAINAGKQISFQYYDYTGLKKKVLKNKGEVYKLSPYKLLWNGDYYYVIGYSEKKNKVICFRVDRIAGIPEMLDKDVIPMPEDFDMENFTKEVFFMFSGEKVLVDLRCDNSLMKTMVDRFGEDVTTLAYDMTSFRIQTEVSASQTFFGWVFGFNGKVQILGLESVREQYRQMIAKADEDMRESEQNTFFNCADGLHNQEGETVDINLKKYFEKDKEGYYYDDKKNEYKLKGVQCQYDRTRNDKAVKQGMLNAVPFSKVYSYINEFLEVIREDNGFTEKNKKIDTIKLDGMEHTIIDNGIIIRNNNWISPEWNGKTYNIYDNKYDVIKQKFNLERVNDILS